MSNSLDPSAQRKARRERLRREREHEQKKLWLKLTAAALVLLLCGGLIYMFARKGSRKAEERGPEPSAPQVEYATVPQATDAKGETETPPTTVIHLAAAGDINICDGVIAAAGENMDFSKMFLDVMPLLAEADLTVANFEGNLVGPPYGSEQCSAPQQLLTVLKNSGIDLLQMANSCSIRNGVSGLGTTLRAIEAEGLTPLGAYASNAEAEEAGGYTIRMVNGIKIAFVAFTKGMDSMALPAGTEKCVNLLYTDYYTNYQKVNREGITKVLKAAAAEKPDITVALLHWGSEYNDMISDTQESIESLLRSQGVDIILGTHPHYVQAIKYNEENGDFLCYSLGDLLSDTAHAGTDYSIILDLEITKDNETGETRVTNYTYTPVYIDTTAGGLQVLRISSARLGYEMDYIGKVTDEAYGGMLHAEERVADRVTVPPEEDDE